MPDTTALPDRLDAYPSEETARRYVSKTQWVELKTELPYGERKRLDLATFRSMSQDADGDRRTQRYEMDLAYTRTLTLALYVVDWNVTRPNGRPLVIPEGIRQRIEFFERISERLGDAIAAEIDALREARAETAEDEPPPNVIEGQSAPVASTNPNGCGPAPVPISSSAGLPAGPGGS